jgi:hypothetical protein
MERPYHLRICLDNSLITKIQSQKDLLLKAGGVVNGGGGDARLIRRFVLDTKKKHLLSEVVGVFSDENPNQNAVTNVKRLLAWIASGRMQLQNAEAQKILSDMIARGFGKDLSQTKFILAERCMDSKSVEKTASAKMDEPRSDICINPDRVVEDFGPYIQDSDLMGLMMHEFSHHYGYEDADHSFAAAIALEYQLDNERRNQEGDPLNYLIK